MASNSSTTRVTSVEVDGNPVSFDKKSTNPNAEDVKQAYVSADSVLGEIPVTTLDQITMLAKNRFASEIVAVGQVTDRQMCAFRMAVIRDLVKQQHKQLIVRVADKREKRNREFYRELRARGVDRDTAIKQSGYNPDL